MPLDQPGQDPPKMERLVGRGQLQLQIQTIQRLQPFPVITHDDHWRKLRNTHPLFDQIARSGLTSPAQRPFNTSPAPPPTDHQNKADPSIIVHGTPHHKKTGGR
jgi:hypothetical protein